MPAPRDRDWWLPRHEQKLLEKQTMGKVDLVFLGDSITHFWEDKAPKVWDQFYGQRNALNLGFSGDRTENVLWRIDHGELDNIKPKLLVMMIGTNNAGHLEESSEATAIGIKAILQELHDKLPQTKILLLAIFPRGHDDSDPLRQLNQGTNRLIAQYADNQRIHFLDINGIFLDQQSILQKSIMDDLLHPNANQYQRWAEAIEPSIKKLMKEN